MASGAPASWHHEQAVADGALDPVGGPVHDLAARRSSSTSRRRPGSARRARRASASAGPPPAASCRRSSPEPCRRPSRGATSHPPARPARVRGCRPATNELKERRHGSEALGPRGDRNPAGPQNARPAPHDRRAPRRSDGSDPRRRGPAADVRPAPGQRRVAEEAGGVAGAREQHSLARHAADAGRSHSRDDPVTDDGLHAALGGRPGAVAGREHHELARVGAREQRIRPDRRNVSPATAARGNEPARPIDPVDLPRPSVHVMRPL